MKKVFVLFAALLVCFVINAQQHKLLERKNKVSFNIGPSFPIGDFASNNAGNENAGYAKTGVNVNLNYDHMFTKYVGIAVNALYGSNKMDHKIISDFMEINVPGADISHYQYVGLIAGPVFTVPVTPKSSIDFKLLGGVGRARSPEATFMGDIYAKQDWASSFTWGTGSDINIQFARNAFFMVGFSYTQMRPDFNIVIMPNEVNSETIPMEMHVSAINLNTGIGIKF
jgi:hypothetical protein